MPPIITNSAIQRRARWIDEIVQIGGHFGNDARRVEVELNAEIERDGEEALLDHLRLCGSIPEHYGHDTSEEKLYSKYTDALLAATFRYIGMTSHVLEERADAADVEAVGDNLSFVADAKAFRLSRTAKNQKDFKVQAMDGWKCGKPHAIIVCPLYQLPARNSQIYQQAITRCVCVFSYSHLALVVRYCSNTNATRAQDLLRSVLLSSEHLNPTKDAVYYWTSINRTMLEFDATISALWKEERVAVTESIVAVKDEALRFLASERERMMRMSREDAIISLLRANNIDGRERAIRLVADNEILGIS